jgi:hypothetical protein
MVTFTVQVVVRDSLQYRGRYQPFHTMFDEWRKLIPNQGK